MDKDLYKKLVDIQAKTRTREDLKHLFVKKNTYAEQKNMMQDALKNPKVGIKQKEMIRRELDKGTFDRETLEVDPKIAARLERNTQEALEEGYKTGKIERYDPRKDEQARRWRSK